MVALTEISTLADFMIWVEQIRPENTTQTKSACFFRGHAHAEWLLLPSVYRPDKYNNSFRSDESKLYHEMLRLDPVAFAEDNTPFERLVRMQHYGLPTRLLDITENHLVALFFACLGECDNDGQVMAFPWLDRRSVMHQHDLPPTSMAGVEAALDLSQLDKQIINSFYTFLLNEKRLMGTSPSGHSQFIAEFRELLANIEELHPHIARLTDPLESFGIFRHLQEKVRQFSDNTLEWLRQEEQRCISERNLRSQIYFNEMLVRLGTWEKKTIAYLCAQMGIAEQGVQQGLASFLHSLTHVNFIVPSLNNKRIRQQAGAFIVFSPVTSKLWTLEDACEGMGCKISRVVIKAEAKLDLLNELANIGITRHYLFPELAEQARYIQTIYPPSPDKFVSPL